MTCNAPSMSGNASYRTMTGDMLVGETHLCSLEPGHDGPHAKRTLTRLGPNVGMETTYFWDDEHELVAQPRIVAMEPDPMTVVRPSTSTTNY